ncbi:MAG: hypothetical protein LIR50_03950 [Bacillota bacterium]|nr:hypothetical protein [Bacillota bacterium]
MTGNDNSINNDYGSDREQFYRTKNKVYKIGNFAEEFSELIPNITEKERRNDINRYIIENNNDLDK